MLEESRTHRNAAPPREGLVGVGDIELTENEWGRVCSSRDKYRLYVVHDRGTPNPRFFRVQDPFRKLTKFRGPVGRLNQPPIS
jgi:hypothetical protein